MSPFWSEWKARAGQWLLHSPFHPLYLRLFPPSPAAKLYTAWLATEGQPAPEPLAQEPLVSVILPVYNPRRDWLAAAVGSVIRQTLIQVVCVGITVVTGKLPPIGIGIGLSLLVYGLHMIPVWNYAKTNGIPTSGNPWKSD